MVFSLAMQNNLDACVEDVALTALKLYIIIYTIYFSSPIFLFF